MPFYQGLHSKENTRVNEGQDVYPILYHYLMLSRRFPFEACEKVIGDLCSGRDFRKGSSRIGYWIIFEKAYIGKDIAIQNNQNRLFLFIIAYRESTVTLGKTFES